MFRIDGRGVEAGTNGHEPTSECVAERKDIGRNVFGLAREQSAGYAKGDPNLVDNK